MRYSYATHLECSVSEEHYDIAKLQGLSALNKPLLARYDQQFEIDEVRRHRIDANRLGLSDSNRSQRSRYQLRAEAY